MFNKRGFARVLIALAVLASLGVVAPAFAAENDLEIEGSGWGHGIGMSQYGALGHALDGETYKEILEFYYDSDENVTAITDGSGSDPLWVGLEQEAVKVELKVVAISGPGTAVTLTRGNGVTATDTVPAAVGQSIVVEHTEDGCVFSIAAGDRSDPGGCHIDVETVDTSTAVQLVRHWEWGTDPENAGDATACSRWRSTVCTYDRGIVRVRPDNDSGIDVSLEINLDDYVTGIGEVPTSWHEEALKAQVVAARTFVLYRSDDRAGSAGSYAEAAENRSWCWCTIYDSSAEGQSGKVNDQVYRGYVAGITASQSWLQAVDDTAGEIVTYEGKPIGAFYSSSNGGATENVWDIWNGGSFLNPYLVAKPDPLTLTAPGNPYPSWSYSKTTGVLQTKLDLDFVFSVDIVDTYDSGTPSHIEVTGRRGADLLTIDTYGSTTTIDGVLVQSWYGLRSPHITGFVLPGDIPFTDIAGNTHEMDIEYLQDIGVALPCDTAPDLFCPGNPMLRRDLASFMVRALNLGPSSKDWFVDDDGLKQEDDINRLREAGITRGCNPPANDHFCPEMTVTRGQTAAFIVRAWDLIDPGPGNWFSDDDGTTFENDIDRLAMSRITLGCNPPDNTHYCPGWKLTRAHMASFLARAIKNL